MNTQKNTRRIATIAFKGIAVAMGVAVIVMNILGTLTINSAITLLSLGLAALAIASLQN
jgi:hypothetical protein